MENSFIWSNFIEEGWKFAKVFFIKIHNISIYLYQTINVLINFWFLFVQIITIDCFLGLYYALFYLTHISYIRWFLRLFINEVKVFVNLSYQLVFLFPNLIRLLHIDWFLTLLYESFLKWKVCLWHTNWFMHSCIFIYRLHT